MISLTVWFGGKLFVVISAAPAEGDSFDDRDDGPAAGRRVGVLRGLAQRLSNFFEARCSKLERLTTDNFFFVMYLR
jgi:hypothetical protein